MPLILRHNLSDYIRDDYAYFCTDPRDASIHVKLEYEAEELFDIR